MPSKAFYELGILFTVGRLFGIRKALKFAVHLPSVMKSGQNRTAYEKIAPCEAVLDGRKVTFPHPDARFIREIVNEKCYTKQAGFEIGSKDIVVDLGANVGIFSILAGMKARDGRVIALEPEDQSFKFLCDNLNANNLFNVEPHQLAISGSDGITNLYVNNPGNSAIFSYNDRDSARVLKVRTISMKTLLSEFQLDHISLLKIDVEGAEFKIFEEDDWLERVNKVAMEVHPNIGNPEMIYSKLRQRNFSINTAPAYDNGMIYLYGLRRS
ncbi:MAG: FkbM family methyltransferase [Nitrososphaerota archaeon]|jgi:FkbM family methyltransferase|nr:FkbM family methyltransferase [Nitrososphaerota archaeon]MDG6922704.1 FkbM family methyltransferase [Nitrososphaerota archaeon]